MTSISQVNNTVATFPSGTLVRPIGHEDGLQVLPLCENVSGIEEPLHAVPVQPCSLQSFESTLLVTKNRVNCENPSSKSMS